MFQDNRKKWFLVLVLTSLIFVRSAFAQDPPEHNIDSESVFYLTDSFLKTKAKSVLSNLLTHFEIKSANQSVGSSPTVQLNQIDVTISPASYTITDNGSGLAFVATNNSLKVDIGEIGIHESIRRNVNGVIAIIRIDVSCVGASVLIKDPTSIISSVLVPAVNGDFLQIKFVNPIVKLMKPSMQLSGFQCTGAKGFEDLINSTIQSALKNTETTNAFLAQILAANSVLLDNQLSFNWNAPRLVFGDASDFTNMQGWVLPNQIVSTPENDWQMTGTFRVILPGHVLQGTPFEKFRKWPLGINTEGGYVAMPDTAFIDLVKSDFAPGQWKHDDLANNFKGFSDLLSNGFEELFLWKDLRKYPKKQPFPIEVTTITPPEVTWASPSSFNLKTTFLVHMMTNNKPYADFTVNSQSEMQFSVANNQLHLQAKKPKLKVSYKWAPSYCSKDCSTIDTSVISNAMQAFLAASKFSFALPPLEFAGTEVSAQSLLHDTASHSVVLQLDPK